MNDFLADDQHYVWHPYTQHQVAPAPLGVVGARGAYLHMQDGTRLLDAIASWWVNIHGHGRQELADAAAAQIKTLDHVLFAGATHEPAVALARLLVEACEARQTGLSRVFYSDDGSTAVEVALKMAYQYHRQRGVTSRGRFLALRGSYHGDTLGAMAVGEPEGFHAIFKPLMLPVDFVTPDQPDELDRILANSGDSYAAVIVEPLLQGAGGMRIYSPGYLNHLAKVCREHGVLVICDEVFTGFYRTGSLFGFEHAGIAPDILCVAKGLCGGVMSLAATLATDAIFEAFLGDSKATALLHGHSFTANPVACGVALASWELLHRPETQHRIAEICAQTRQHIAQLQKAGAGEHARCIGTIGATDAPVARAGYHAEIGPKLFEAAKRRGVLLRPLGNVLYTVPPYCVSDDELALIYQTMGAVIEETAGR